MKASLSFGLLIAFLWSGIAAGPSHADPGYAAYTDWVGWARLSSGEGAGLASSYDRSGANIDYNHYESPAGLVTDAVPAIIKTINQPGVIYRFWMPHATDSQIVRMYFDGELTPRIDTTSETILDGNFAYFTAPLVDTFAGGQVCYEPIFFAQSIRIETMTQPLTGYKSRHYYQYSYITFPPGTLLTTYDGTLSPEQQAARDATVALFNNVGQHPAGQNPAAVAVPTPPTSIPAGATLTLFTGNGPGIIRRLNVRMDAAADAALDGLHLEVTYDAETTPAIDVPVAQFFGAGHLRATYQSLPIGTDSPDGFYCYWPMPFRDAVSVSLVNTTTSSIDIDSAWVEYEAVSVPNDMCYFRAHAFTDTKATGQVYHPILSATGRGHYVGNLLFTEQDAFSFAMLEGDDVITIDGAEVLYGTGLEDAYNGGFYYNWVGTAPPEPEGPDPQSASRPLNGILYVHREDGVEHARADQYRWYIADRIPFYNSIDVDIENRYAVDGATFASVAFWYQQPTLAGDIDDDGAVNENDLPLFIDVLLELDNDPEHIAAADTNGDTLADGRDIRGFVLSFLNQPPA